MTTSDGTDREEVRGNGLLRNESVGARGDAARSGGKLVAALDHSRNLRNTQSDFLSGLYRQIVRMPALLVLWAAR